ncbi:hypothetical protein FKW77_007246 [Venturia effusa]|uniref:Uncharacterized protein n=1 Tax=Venturia effusa TaxID=50376 RepID=A0A517LHK5_9PEZI|nr:hypothetical protein FKW77_007246 [Venturia effusa]
MAPKRNEQPSLGAFVTSLRSSRDHSAAPPLPPLSASSSLADAGCFPGDYNREIFGPLSPLSVVAEAKANLARARVRLLERDGIAVRENEEGGGKEDVFSALLEYLDGLEKGGGVVVKEGAGGAV